MNTFLKPSKLKVIIAILLFILSLIYSEVAQSSVGYLDIMAWIFFPLRLSFFFEHMLYTHIQDMMVCRVPGCGNINLILTVLSSGMIYYILACVVSLTFSNKQKR